MNFYQIRTLQGTFWVQASRASDAHRAAKQILGHDEYALARDSDLGFMPEPETGSLASCGHPANEDGECGCAWWPEPARDGFEGEPEPELQPALRPGDYGHNVARFNEEHNPAVGCQLARTPGSDRTECDTHHAWVSHGVPVLLRDI